MFHQRWHQRQPCLQPFYLLAKGVSRQRGAAAVPSMQPFYLLAKGVTRQPFASSSCFLQQAYRLCLNDSSLAKPAPQHDAERGRFMRSVRRRQGHPVL